MQYRMFLLYWDSRLQILDQKRQSTHTQCNGNLLKNFIIVDCISATEDAVVLGVSAAVVGVVGADVGGLSEGDDVKYSRYT